MDIYDNPQAIKESDAVLFEQFKIILKINK